MQEYQLIQKRYLHGLMLMATLLVAVSCEKQKSSTNPSTTKMHNRPLAKGSKTVNVQASGKNTPAQDSTAIENEKLDVVDTVVCNIPTREGAGAFIKSVVPNGAWVEKDDQLIVFDSYGLMTEFENCTIKLNQAVANLKQAEVALLQAETELALSNHQKTNEERRLKSDVNRWKEALSKAELTHSGFKIDKRLLLDAHKSLTDLTEESKKKLAQLKSEVGKAQDGVIAASNLSEQEKKAQLQQNEAQRKVEVFENEFKQKKDAISKMVDFHLKQINEPEKTIAKTRENLHAWEVEIAKRGLNEAMSDLDAYSRFYLPKNRKRLSTNLEAAQRRHSLLNQNVEILTRRLSEITMLLKQATVNARQSGRVKYADDMKLKAGMECRLKQVLLLIMRPTSSRPKPGNK